MHSLLETVTAASWPGGGVPNVLNLPQAKCRPPPATNARNAAHHPPSKSPRVTTPRNISCR